MARLGSRQISIPNTEPMRQPRRPVAGPCPGCLPCSPFMLFTHCFREFLYPCCQSRGSFSCVVVPAYKLILPCTTGATLALARFLQSASEGTGRKHIHGHTVIHRPQKTRAVGNTIMHAIAPGLGESADLPRRVHGRAHGQNSAGILRNWAAGASCTRAHWPYPQSSAPVVLPPIPASCTEAQRALVRFVKIVC